MRGGAARAVRGGAALCEAVRCAAAILLVCRCLLRHRAGIPYAPLAGKPFTSFNLLCVCRIVTYGIHVKLYSSGGRLSSLALKSHMFAVACDAPGAVCRTALNHTALEFFTLTFIGDSNVFRVLQQRTGGFRECEVDVARSLGFLRYNRDAGICCAGQGRAGKGRAGE